MSATVTYKGATLTTATNQTRTLDTAGTYLEDDITITDVTTIPTGTKNISITANGTTTEDVTSYASASITANVPNSYTASDEGKVVSNGSLVSQSSATYTENDTYDTTLVDEVTVNVSGGGISVDDIAQNLAPSGSVTLGNTVASIGNSAFRYKPITSISGSGVTTVGDFAFENCSSLTSISFPSATTIGSSAFRVCKLASASFPAATKVGANAFQTNTYTLLSVSLPEATTISNNFVFDCQKLEDVSIPKCTKINGNSFQQCYALEVIDLPKVTQIDVNAFYNCRKLGTMILRHTSVVTLSNVSAFTNTLIRGYNGGSGVIYVPSSLVASYKTASNWSSIFNEGHVTFTAIEGSVYE